MENKFFLGKIAEKISNVIQYPIPLTKPECDTVAENCARLYFDGIRTDSSNLQKHYDFRFRFFSSDHHTAINIADKAAEAMRNSQPEIFSDGDNKFYIRYCNIKSSVSDITDFSGIVYFFTEVEFSVTA